jgi:hypothetical protein
VHFEGLLKVSFFKWANCFVHVRLGQDVKELRGRRWPRHWKVASSLQSIIGTSQVKLFYPIYTGNTLYIYSWY